MAYRDGSGQRSMWPYVVAALIVAGGAVGFFVVRDFIAFGRERPTFPALAEAPDESLHGTVAFFGVVADPKTQPTGGCVRVIAAAGSPVRDVMCFEGVDTDTGPQLVFLPDGRLEVTMFSWPTGGSLTPAWQKIVDVRTGEIEDIPGDQLPAVPIAIGPTVNANGDEIGAATSANRVTLTIDQATGGSRTLWSADVSPDYSMTAVWGGDGAWVLAHDGRLLVATLDDPSLIRVLVEETEGRGGFGSTDPPIAIYAVTGEDLLGT